ncbi:MAG: hypothetical protein V4708_16940 [Bacteroidota bacterium]
MRNRAKCKLCNTTIESFHDTDLQFCECKAIGIDGGNSSYKVYANDFAHVVRIDDNDKEVTVKEKLVIAEEVKPLSRDDMLKELDMMCDEIDNLPQHAMQQPVNQYDFYRLCLLVRSILRAK